MPHVDIRWRPVPHAAIDQAMVADLSRQMPSICAPALSVPGGREYQPSGIVVKVNQQSEMDINIPPILIEIFATGTPEQIARRHEARDKIVEGIRSHLGQEMKGVSVWILLPETSFGTL